MMQAELSPFTPLLAFALTAGAGLAVYLCDRYWPRTPEQEAQRAYAEWFEECRRAGLTHEERQREYRIRFSLARLRRIASDRVLQAPAEFRVIVESVAREEARLLALTDAAAGKQFAEIASTLPLSDVLYPDALQAVDRKIKVEIEMRKFLMPTPDPQMLADHTAVLRTVRR
jgi:hypothetical protein